MSAAAGRSILGVEMQALLAELRQLRPPQPAPAAECSETDSGSLQPVEKA